MIKINKEATKSGRLTKEVREYVGIADNKGIDMLMPKTTLKDLVKIGMQARAVANEHRNAVYFEASILKSDATEIFKLLKDCKDLQALKTLKKVAIAISVGNSSTEIWRELEQLIKENNGKSNDSKNRNI
jgi:hypothetical protein